MRRTTTIAQALCTLTVCVVCNASPFSSGGTHTSLREETSVSATTDTTARAVPGSILTAAFRITNSAGIEQRYLGQVRLPSDWRLLTRTGPFSVPAGATGIQLVTFAVPRVSPAGEYEVEFRVHDTTMAFEPVGASVRVIISPVRELSLDLIDAPRFITAGGVYEILYSLTNKGNATENVGLHAWSVNGLPVSTDSTIRHIGPGERDTVRVVAGSDPRLTRRITQVTFLRATIPEDPTVTVSGTCGVDIIPVARESKNMYHWYPSRTLVRMAGTDGISGVQAEFSGFGTLDPYGEHRFAYLIRSPDVQRYSMLGQRDEYFLTYGTDRFAVRGGDLTYRLSPLTEFGRYAFGAGGSLTIDRFSVGGFFNTTRFGSPRVQERAGFVNYMVDPSAIFSVLYLGKEIREKTDIVSLRTVVKPFTHSQVDLEYASGFTGGEVDYASSMRFSGRETWVYYDIRFIHADPGYRGYYRDVNYRAGNVILYPWKDLRFEALLREEERNLNRDTSLYAAPANRFYQFGVGYGNYITVLYRTDTFEDRMPGAQFRRKERTVQFRSSYTLPSLNLHANVEIGTQEEQPSLRERPFRRYSMFGNIMPANWHSYGFSVEYENGGNILTGEPTDRITGNLNARAMFWGNTRVFTNLHASRTVEGPRQSYSFLDIGIEYRLPFGHFLTLQSRLSWYFPSYGGDEHAYMLQYSIPFSVPLGRTADAGTLSGTITDSETGRGVPDVLVYAGNAAALSDGGGEFVFPSITPGIHSFQVDLASLGSQRVLLEQPPRTVAIQGGEKTGVTIRSVIGASVSGAVVLY
ncbi:MAG: carboxypeptidase regulatory-like domain-containing protein, partial [Bacteroidetes bacterium]|nr:carboxypeptidase regulatory-like domain-containing protein [Bacteroidota bacterium]